ncbi:MAG: hypothetical protein FJ214_04120 [Ignavibacteria bacterium]|nr:hypothetical protein [Ignavibacteria bacterium]
MKTYKIKLMIDQYFDNELPKSSEAFLFTELSRNTEGREYFKELNKIKFAIQQSNEEFPNELDRRILYGIRNSKSYPVIFWKSKLLPIVSYSFAAIMLLFSLFMFFELRVYRTELKESIHQINHKQETINLLINSLPTVQVESELNNKVIIKAAL